MKSNFFKIFLPAFALMLAITASIAFTPVPGVVKGYEQVLDVQGEIIRCDYEKDCQTENSGTICKLSIFEPQLYGIVDEQANPQVTCIIPLYEIPTP